MYPYDNQANPMEYFKSLTAPATTVADANAQFGLQDFGSLGNDFSSINYANQNPSLYKAGVALDDELGINAAPVLDNMSGIMGGLNTAASIGTGLFNLYNSFQNGKAQRDYYKHKIGMDKEILALNKADLKNSATRQAQKTAFFNEGYRPGSAGSDKRVAASLAGYGI